MNNARVWLFRGLVAIAVSLMVASWILPWWSVNVYEAGLVIIHPWGLEQHLGDIASMIARAEMPVWMAPLMWIYLGICVVALLYGSWLGEKEVKIGKFKFKWAKLLIGGVGLSYIVVAVVAVIFAAIRTGDFWDLKLIGYTYISLGPPAESGAYANLQFGYWLAHGVGLLCIILALLRDKIIGKRKPKLNA